jgi:hypothetical protein
MDTVGPEHFQWGFRCLFVVEVAELSLDEFQALFEHPAAALYQTEPKRIG